MAADQSDTQLYGRLLQYVLPYKKVFYIALAGMVIQAVMEPAKAALLEPMLDKLFVDKDPQMIIIVPVLIVLVFLVSGIATFVGTAAVHWVANRVILDLRSDMFHRLLCFPSETFDRRSGSSLISRFTYDVIQIKTAAAGAITTIIRDTLVVVGLLAWMFYVQWQLTLIALVGTPFVILIVQIIRKRLRRMSNRTQETMADINQALSEVIEGQRIVKLFGGQEQEQDRFANIIRANRNFEMKFVYASAASGPIVQLIAAVALSVIVYVAATQAVQQAFSIGQFASFIAAMVMLMDPLKRLVKVNEHIQRGLAGCESVFSVIDETVESDPGGIDNIRLSGDIQIRQLNYRYKDDAGEVLQDINLHIRPRETVALVGISGSGKSTLANLIPMFYQYREGSILLDGRDIRDMSLAGLRANIGLVSQDILLFNDSIRKNIAYGTNRGASEEKIRAAAVAAHAMEFIDELPQGLDTPVGERGSRLSGGQRQRIALARALLKDAPVLILDEATSALDNESERHIQLAMESLRKEKTCLVIAHRLSTIVSADRIVVMDRGRVAETGTHSELMSKGGLYTKLYNQPGND